jgi:hypothetical protein
MLLTNFAPFVVPGLGILVPNVFRDHFIRNVSTGADEVAPCPQTLTPALLAQLAPVTQQLMGGFALNGRHSSLYTSTISP